MRIQLAVLCLSMVASPLLAREGPGGGGIVIRDDAPVYAESKGDRTERKLRKLNRGDAVAIQTFRGVYWYDEVDGRIQVVYLPNADPKAGPILRGWMNPNDVSRFALRNVRCERFLDVGMKRWWDACFQEARDQKLEALRLAWAQADAAANPAR